MTPTEPKPDRPTPTEPTEPTEPESAAGGFVVEVGWILAGPMDEVDHQAALRTRETLVGYLGGVLPEFEWKLPLARHEGLAQEPRERPIRLFDFAATERETRRWDFAFLITEADLLGHEKPFALAASSTALGAAVISTSRIDPGAEDTARPSEQRTTVIAHRIEALALHCLGHLAGLAHEEEPTDCMADFQTVEDLDSVGRYSPEQLGRMRNSLREVADRRLEERPELQRASRLSFYARGAWVNRGEIVQAVARARPWLFPVRLSRLATAAVSALVVLVMTAESWELGMSLSPAVAAALATVCILATTAYVVRRQHLLVRRERPGASERKVVANVSAPMIVLLGMATTFLLLFALTLGVGLTVFRRSVVESWAASVQVIGLPQYLCLSAYIASVALVVGALGASFEDQLYFRHVTLVDEEV